SEHFLPERANSNGSKELAAFRNQRFFVTLSFHHNRPYCLVHQPTRSPHEPQNRPPLRARWPFEVLAKRPSLFRPRLLQDASRSDLAAVPGLAQARAYRLLS